MPSMDIGIEILRGKDAAAEVVLTVDFKFRSGSPAHYGSLNYAGDPGDPPEVEIETIFWPYERQRRPDEPGKTSVVKDHYEVPLGLLPTGIYEAIEAHICEHYNPADYGPDY